MAVLDSLRTGKLNAAATAVQAAARRHDDAVIPLTDELATPPCPS
jgi:hypothetical protein